MRRKVLNSIFIAAMVVTMAGCSNNTSDAQVAKDESNEKKQEEVVNAADLTEEQIVKNQQKYKDELYTKEGERISMYLGDNPAGDYYASQEFYIYDYADDVYPCNVKKVIFYPTYEDYETGCRYDQMSLLTASYVDEAACYVEYEIKKEDANWLYEEEYDWTIMLNKESIVYNAVNEYVYTEDAVIVEGTESENSGYSEKYRDRFAESNDNRKVTIVGNHGATIVYRVDYYDDNGNEIAKGMIYSSYTVYEHEDILMSCKVNGVPILIRDDTEHYIETYTTDGFAGMMQDEELKY